MQPDLFTETIRQVDEFLGSLARKRDPQTSHAAAARVGEFTGLHEARIVLALKDHGPMTVAEIARETGLQEQQTNKRCSDLEHKGAISTTGATRPGPSGRQQRVWRAA